MRLDSVVPQVFALVNQVLGHAVSFYHALLNDEVVSLVNFLMRSEGKPIPICDEVKRVVAGRFRSVPPNLDTTNRHVTDRSQSQDVNPDRNDRQPLFGSMNVGEVPSSCDCSNARDTA